jgi:hypothetical protein
LFVADWLPVLRAVSISYETFWPSVSVVGGCMTAAAGALADELLASFELHSVIVASEAALFALIGVALDALLVAD